MRNSDGEKQNLSLVCFLSYKNLLNRDKQRFGLVSNGDIWLWTGFRTEPIQTDYEPFKTDLNLTEPVLNNFAPFWIITNHFKSFLNLTKPLWTKQNRPWTKLNRMAQFWTIQALRERFGLEANKFNLLIAKYLSQHFYKISSDSTFKSFPSKPPIPLVSNFIRKVRHSSKDYMKKGIGS